MFPRWPRLSLKDWLTRAVARFLNQEVDAYEITVPNNMAQLYRHIRRGDVVLVDGERRISQVVKYATQSQWSHCALYLGDELLRRGGALRAHALGTFGELADRLVVEALTDEGVVAAPLEKYRRHNLRVCRPYAIDSADLDRVVESAIADLGKQYDERNLLDLALVLLSPFKFGILKTRTIDTCLGNCTEFQVICSGMLAKAFQRVGYLVLPQVDLGETRGETPPGADPYGLPPRMRHYSQIVPRDFDLSPNFQVVNVNLMEGGPFDSRHRTRTAPGTNH